MAMIITNNPYENLKRMVRGGSALAMIYSILFSEAERATGGGNLKGLRFNTGQYVSSDPDGGSYNGMVIEIKEEYDDYLVFEVIRQEPDTDLVGNTYKVFASFNQWWSDSQKGLFPVYEMDAEDPDQSEPCNWWVNLSIYGIVRNMEDYDWQDYGNRVLHIEVINIAEDGASTNVDLEFSFPIRRQSEEGYSAGIYSFYDLQPEFNALTPAGEQWLSEWSQREENFGCFLRVPYYLMDGDSTGTGIVDEPQYVQPGSLWIGAQDYNQYPLGIKEDSMPGILRVTLTDDIAEPVYPEGTRLDFEAYYSVDEETVEFHGLLTDVNINWWSSTSMNSLDVRGTVTECPDEEYNDKTMSLKELDPVHLQETGFMDVDFDLDMGDETIHGAVNVSEHVEDPEEEPEEEPVL